MRGKPYFEPQSGPLAPERWLENFDVMGAWRDHYRGMERGEKITGIDPAGHPYTYLVGQPVDASAMLLAGGGLKHGQHLAFDNVQNKPLCNLFVTMLQNMGLEVDAFGSSTGTLNEINR